MAEGMRNIGIVPLHVNYYNIFIIAESMIIQNVAAGDPAQDHAQHWHRTDPDGPIPGWPLRIA